MKQIQPVQIWTNGQVQTGNYINAYIINDNLLDSATFYWAIFTSDIDGNQLSEGNLSIIDPEYDVWGQSSDINQAAYEWICDQLGLILI
jgi:hypothetical protein